MQSQVLGIDLPDPTRLRDHLRQCAFASSRLHRVLCAIEALDEFLAPRFVTTVTLIAAVVFVGSSLPV